MEMFKVQKCLKAILRVHNMQFEIKGQIVFGKAFEVLPHPSRKIYNNSNINIFSMCL